MKLIKRNCLLLLYMIGISPCFAQYPAGSPVAVNGKLKVIGKYLRNECGNPVQLRGMATHGVQWFGNCVNPSSIGALSTDWNADVLRISMYIQEGGYVTNPSYWKTWIDNVVDECGKKGIYAVIDFHVHIPGDPMSYINEAREFWAYMAAKHKGKKHVLYEICNEPNGVSWSRVKQYANEIIPLIRTSDPFTVIIVGSSTWSQDVHVVAADRLQYSNLVYSLHFYNQGSELMTKAEKAIALGLPIFVTEFGTTNPASTEGPFYDQMEVWNAWMFDNKISWANWSFADKGELSAALIPGSCGSGSWNNTSPSGSWVKNKIKTPSDNFVCNGDTGYQKSAAKAFIGNSWAIPGKIEAENYDLGANGLAYRNYEKTSSIYRTDGIEVRSCTDSLGGYAIGNMDVGEWVNYSLTCSQTGVYDISIRVSSAEEGKLLYLELDGKSISGIVQVPMTKSSYQTILVPNVNIKSGVHDFKLHSITKAPLINYFSFVPSVAGVNRAPIVYFLSPSSQVIYPEKSTITISANALDFDGNIQKIEFYEGQTKLGESIAFPYFFNWANIPVGSHSLSVIAFDNLGKASTAKVIVNVAALAEIDQKGSGLRGQYFNNANLSGTHVISRVDSVVNFNWGEGSPGPSLSTDNFSVVWSGKIKPKYSENYTFSLLSDDGVRLYVDNVLVAGNWENGQQSSNGTVTLIANALHDIRLEYYDGCCIAQAQLSWASPSQTKQVVPKSNLYPTYIGKLPLGIQLVSPVANQVFLTPASISLQAEVYNPGGTSVKVEFYNGTTLLATDLTAPYSFIWSGMPEGAYAITAIAKDDQNMQSTSSVLNLTVASNNGPSGTGLKAEYFNNKLLLGPATLTRVDPIIFFDWLEGSPSPSLHSDLFSVRWTGQIQPLYSEEYTFYTTSDDGVRLYVNNVLLVDNWTNHGSTVNSGKITLTANQKYAIRAEFYDDCCSAEMKLQWSSNSQIKQAVPQLNLFPDASTVQFPIVSIIGPNNNDSFTAPAAINLTSSASDLDGSISKVEYFSGPNKIGEATTSPYSFNWTNVGVGTYGLSAKAYDNEGNATTSNQTVTIMVASIVGPAGSGLKAEYFNNKSLTGPPSLTRIDPVVDFGWLDNSPGTGINTDQFSARWSGQVQPLNSEEYTFYTTSDDGVRLYVDNVLLIDNWTNHGTTVNNGKITLTANQKYSIRAEFYDDCCFAEMRLAWSSQSQVKQTIPSISLFPTSGSTVLAPSISILTPTNNATFVAPAAIPFTVNASDQDGSISKVEFYNGITKLGESTTSPFTFNWANVGIGAFNLTAKAFDNEGNSTVSSPIAIVVGIQPNLTPTVNMTSPIGGTSFTSPANVVLAAIASDIDGTISKVEFFHGTTKIGEDLSSPYSYIWPNAPIGTFMMSAKATDNVGGVGNSIAVPIVVNPATNKAPTVVLTLPATGTSFTAPATISLSATASDVDGTVSKLEFFNGSTKIGEDPSSPFTLNWPNVGVGTYVITAKATDNSSNVSTSAATSINVTSVSSGSCTTEALPIAANWVVRNDWSDQTNSSGVFNDPTGLKVSHRTWGQDRLYLIQTGKKYSVSTARSYTVSFDFRNDPTMAATTLEIGFATGTSGIGPITLQPLSSIPAGAANGNFASKSVTIKPISSNDVSIVIGLKWPSQVNKQFNAFIKNMSVCTTTVSPRVEGDMALESSESLGLTVEIAPNPADHNFQVQLNGTQETVKLSVTNITGIMIYESEFASNAVVSIGGNWGKGLYILKVQDGTDIKVKKLQKN